MQATSKTWQRLRESGASYETKLNIAGVDYGEDMLKSVSTPLNVFEGNEPCVGSCVSAEIEITMQLPDTEIPRMAKIKPYIRLTDGVESSEWLQKGVFYIDTRSIDYNAGTIKIHGYDAMRKGDVDFDAGTVITNWPRKDIDVVKLVAEHMGVSLDARTTAAITNGYDIQLPTGYSYRETLGNIAALYAGCFVMSDIGQLYLIGLADIGTDSNSYLIDEWGNGITFGGDLIGI